MRRMGRPRRKNRDMPPGLERDRLGGWHFRPTSKPAKAAFDRLHPGKKSIALGRDKEAARRWWLDLFREKAEEANAPADSIAALLFRFERDEIPLMHPRTADDAKRYLARLAVEFGSMRFARTEADAFDAGVLRPMHLSQYLRAQAADRPVAANREVKLLARVFHIARGLWGVTTYNPVAGVLYNPEAPRAQYQDDARYRQVYDAAPELLQLMMDLAQMHGARRGMLLRITLADITEAGLWLTLNKRKRTERPRRQLVQWSDDLRLVIDRALALRAKTRGGQAEVADLPSAPLFLNAKGRQVTETGFNSLWARAIAKAGIPRAEFHFHDIRAKAASDADADQAQGMLGHQDPRTTTRVYRRKHITVTPLPRIGGKAK